MLGAFGILNDGQRFTAEETEGTTRPRRGSWLKLTPIIADGAESDRVTLPVPSGATSLNAKTTGVYTVVGSSLRN